MFAMSCLVLTPSCLNNALKTAIYGYHLFTCPAACPRLTSFFFFKIFKIGSHQLQVTVISVSKTFLIFHEFVIVGRKSV